ncbi:hypothetical protein KP509_11G063600 [Ceratopteris richardii]|uniref:1-acyl-sn-glycerol-3-phosphate acyltransferase n=1 Tax=Ceratopteris richardii TaxID=49495 RepID=A0A8T2TW16_CERRI|nr:hypothetical protein KP509_11G063600 [Ceratopteris richardii]
MPSVVPSQPAHVICTFPFSCCDSRRNLWGEASTRCSGLGVCSMDGCLISMKTLIEFRRRDTSVICRRRDTSVICRLLRSTERNGKQSSAMPYFVGKRLCRNGFSAGPTFMQRARAFCFYFTTYLVAVPLFFVMLLVQPVVLILDRHKRKAQHFINKIWASLTIGLFYKAQIIGQENLPGPDDAAVYVSNHQSFLDIYTLFLLDRPFKFISKTSIFLIPIIGWSMYLTGHVPLRRMDTRSQMECLRHCQKLIKQGVPVFFFPEGTRSRDGKLAQFKRGAFTIAAKTQVPVVPITLIGTGMLMPNGLEGTLRPGSVKVIIHPPLHGSNADELCQQSRDIISKTLLQHGFGVH